MSILSITICNEKRSKIVKLAINNPSLPETKKTSKKVFILKKGHLWPFN